MSEHRSLPPEALLTTTRAVRNMHTVGVAFDGRNTIQAAREQAQAAEAAGATNLWVASHLFLRDPNDDMVLATARAADATYLITRDLDLLTLQTYEGITILTPEAFMAILRERGRLNP